MEDLPGEPIGERLLSPVNFDTEDGSALTAGIITLRRRTEEGRAVWQLKLPRSRGRLELEEPADLTAPQKHSQAIPRVVGSSRVLRRG
jgi:hypothetical protein